MSSELAGKYGSTFISNYRSLRVKECTLKGPTGYRRLQSLSNFISLYKRSGTGIFGALVTASFLILALFAPILAPMNPWQMGTAQEVLNPPSRSHLLGTDDVGRDILSELAYGTRVSILVGILAAAISAIIGGSLGLISGYYGGLVGDLTMRITDIFLVIPDLPLMIVLASVLGSSIWNIILVIGVLGWTGTARIIRSQTLSLKERAYVEASRAIGASNMHLILREIAPNTIPLIFANTVIVTGRAVMTEAVLSFLGLGDPTQMSWGMMLHYAFASGSATFASWYVAPPGICIALLVLGLTFSGRALDEILNPRLRRR